VNIVSRPSDRQLIEQYLEALRALPDVHPNPPHWETTLSETDQRCDAQIDLVVDGKPLTLVIEAKKSVYPRDVHQVLGQMRRFAHDHSPASTSNDRILIIVAGAISPGAKDLLRSERVGYYDRGGSLFNSTAPVVKLRAATSEEEHLGLLGLLGSSTACFWINRFATTKAAKGSTRARKRRHGNASSWQTALVSNNSL